MLLTFSSHITISHINKRRVTFFSPFSSVSFFSSSNPSKKKNPKELLHWSVSSIFLPSTFLDRSIRWINAQCISSSSNDNHSLKQSRCLCDDDSHWTLEYSLGPSVKTKFFLSVNSVFRLDEWIGYQDGSLTSMYNYLGKTQ